MVFKLERHMLLILSVLLIILFLIIFLTGSSRQETIRGSGESDNWKGHIIYELTDSHFSDRGGLEYLGNEEIIYVKYKVIKGKLGESSGERFEQENLTAISFGMGMTNNYLTKDETAIELNHSYVEIDYITKNGEYKEKIELEVED